MPVFTDDLPAAHLDADADVDTETEAGAAPILYRARKGRLLFGVCGDGGIRGLGCLAHPWAVRGLDLHWRAWGARVPRRCAPGTTRAYHSRITRLCIRALHICRYASHRVSCVHGELARSRL